LQHLYPDFLDIEWHSSRQAMTPKTCVVSLAVTTERSASTL
jgi:hypothetical protein